MIADKEQLEKKLGGGDIAKAEEDMAKNDPKEFARHDHFSIVLFALLVFVPVGIAF